MMKTIGLAILVVLGAWWILTAVAGAAEPTTPPTSRPTTNPAEVYSAWPFDAKEAVKRQNDTAKSLGLPKLLTLDLGNHVPLRLVLIPAGTFVMGCPKAEQNNRVTFKDEVQHEVTISKPFYLGTTHVTVDQYARFVKDTGQNHKDPAFKQTGDHPVVDVGWDDAQAFCAWLAKKTGKTVGLPTEAQWEYACRAGTQTQFSFGEKDTDLGDYSWYGVNSGGTTHPVARKKSNAWGLYDMNGNVWQWCADYYGPYVEADKIDPAGPQAGKQRVLRGASWMSDGPANCRSAYRRDGTYSVPPKPYDGFRVTVATGGN